NGSPSADSSLRKTNVPSGRRRAGVSRNGRRADRAPAPRDSAACITSCWVWRNVSMVRRYSFMGPDAAGRDRGGAPAAGAGGAVHRRDGLAEAHRTGPLLEGLAAHRLRIGGDRRGGGARVQRNDRRREASALVVAAQLLAHRREQGRVIGAAERQTLADGPLL